MRSERYKISFTPPPHVFIFGLGYIGLPLAKCLVRENVRVSGLTRGIASANMARECSIDVMCMSNMRPRTIQAFVKDRLNTTTHVLSTVAPGVMEKACGDDVIESFAHVILDTAPNWVGYVSSTCVYGDHGDVVITEESGTLTHTKTGLRRLNCERAWKNLQRKDMKCFIFRVAGIYGPNRSALHTILGDINALSHVNEAGCDVPASRIHIDDIVSALCAAMMKDVKVEPVSKCCIINLADDLPTCRRVVFEYAASLLQLPSLRALRAHAARNVRATESRSGKRRRKERVCKRISNDKMKQMLRIQLKYPTFRHGLIAIVASLIQ